MHLADNNGLPQEGNLLMVVVPAAAACMVLWNLRSVVGELQEVRITPPARVLEDEAELHPGLPPAPTSPWDEPAI
jgi:hypothetical protein